MFCEWFKANELGQDMNFPSNMLYAATLKSAARLLGETKWDQEAQRIQSTIRKVAWCDGRFVDYAVRNEQRELVVTDHGTLFPNECICRKADSTGAADPTW